MVPALSLGTNIATINVMNSKILIITILISFALAILTPSAIMATESNEPSAAALEEQEVDQPPAQDSSRDALQNSPQETDQTSIEEDQAESPSSGLTEEQVEILKGAGLSSATISELGLLYQDPGRTRPPALTFDEVLKLVEAGLPDDKIRLLIGLDALSGGAEEMPVSPENVRELLSSGLSVNTIGAMLLGGNFHTA